MDDIGLRQEGLSDVVDPPRPNWLVRFAARGTHGLSSREAERARRFNVLFGTLLVLAVLGLIGGAIDPNTAPYMIVMPALFTAALLPAYLWTSADYPSRFRRGAHLVVALLVAVDISGPALFLGGLGSGVMIYMALVPLFAALLFLEVRPTLIWTGITAAGAAFVAGAGALVGTPPTSPPTAEDTFGSIISVIALYAILIGATSIVVSRHRLRETEAAKEAEEVARREAVDARDSISRFLATMSHEMRTPMNVILGLAEVLEVSDLDRDQADAVDTLLGRSRELVSLMNAVLDLSKLDAGMMEIERVEVDLHNTVQDAVESLGRHAESKGLDLSCRIGDRVPPRLIGDPLRIRQVLVNLMENAVKFTTAGEVVIDVSTTGDSDVCTVRVSVTDTGIGVDPSEVERLFFPFEQADVSTTRKFGGTGLGLAISRTLVEHMGGSIGFDARPGGGSVFWFELPVEIPCTREPQRLPPPSSRVLSEAEAAAGASDDAAQLTGVRILLAEDDAENRALCEMYLSMLGCETVGVEDGVEAVAEYGRGRFDAVLMDVEMPNLDGYEATRRIRAHEATEHVPIIALTAGAFASERRKCLDAGMDTIVTKPYTIDELGAALADQVCERPSASTG